MSPQAAVPSHRISHRVSLVESDDNSFLSSLIEAADEAYQKTSDESLPSLSAAAEVHAGPGRVANQNNKNTNSNRPARFNLRKRKVVSVSGTSCAGSLSAVNTDFLSGLFADLEQTASTDTATDANVQEDEEHYVTDGESCPNTPVPSPRKRARLGRTLSRCTKSYVSLSSVLRTNSTDSYVQKFQEQCTKIGGSHRGKAARALPTLPADDELTSTSVKPTAPHGVASDVLADSLTAAAALADAVFPHLPHTVSDSPLRKSPRTASQNIISADLTAQPSASSTEASSGCVAEPLHVAPELTLAEAFFGTAEAEGSEDGGPASAAVTSTCTEADESSSGKGDSFGWFLDLDTPTDASEEHITDAYADGNGSGSSSSSSLAFQAPVSVANHDAEVEWAKAADTVDDVLGDLPF